MTTLGGTFGYDRAGNNNRADFGFFLFTFLTLNLEATIDAITRLREIGCGNESRRKSREKI
jgi:hypothetical protein